MIDGTFSMSSNGSHNAGTNKNGSRSFDFSIRYGRGLLFIMAAVGMYSLLSISVLTLGVDSGRGGIGGFAASATTLASDQTQSDRDVTSDAGNVSAPESLPLLPPPSAALPTDANATEDITVVFNYLRDARDAIRINNTQQALLNIDQAEIALKTLLEGDTGPALTPPNATATTTTTESNATAATTTEPDVPMLSNNTATIPPGENVTSLDVMNNTDAFP
jgi:hypothetical protein